VLGCHLLQAQQVRVVSTVAVMPGHMIYALLLLFLRLSLNHSETTICFDPMEPSYQVQPKYRPDKSSTWTYGLDADGWMIAHDALRGEVSDFELALNESNHRISHSQTMAIQKWWNLHLKHMQSHHRNEDKIVKRFVSRRFIYPEFMENDHILINAHLVAINNVITELVNTTTNIIAGNENWDSEVRLPTVMKLQLAWKAYMDDLLPHLKAEEDICIPLMRAYFTMSQVHRLSRRLAQSGPRVETGAIIHYSGRERVLAVMEAQNIPVALQMIAWALILGPRHGYYQREMIHHLETIRSE
jgi:hypothetical protein